jgi:transcriptional regulator with XRE-family HTH domain
MQMTDSGGIGARVRAARERIGCSREALAFHSGISWSAIAQVESGRRLNLRPSTLSALSRTLGVSIDYLVDSGRAPTTMLDHSVFTYGADDQFQTTMGSFLAEGLERSEAVLVVTTAPNIELLREHLGKAAGSVQFVDSTSFLTTPVAALTAFKAFTEASLGRGARWVRILGEPRWAGRSETDVRLWTRFESLFNLVFAASPMTVTCPYDERSVAPEILSQAHATHPHTLSQEGISQSSDYVEPGSFSLEPEQPSSLKPD